MSLLPSVKNSLMLLLSLVTSIFAASRPGKWQFAMNGSMYRNSSVSAFSALAGGFCFLAIERGKTDEIGFKAQMNNERDRRHINGGKLEGINEQMNTNSGRCILGSIVPK